MKLERTTTGLIIHGPDEIMKRKILQYFSLSNPLREYFIYSGNDKSRKPIFGNEHDVVYISSGFLNVNDGYTFITTSIDYSTNSTRENTNNNESTTSIKVTRGLYQNDDE